LILRAERESGERGEISLFTLFDAWPRIINKEARFEERRGRAESG